MVSIRNSYIPTYGRNDQTSNLNLMPPSYIKISQINQHQANKSIPSQKDIPKPRSTSTFDQLHQSQLTLQVSNCLHRTHNALNQLKVARNRSQDKRSMRMSSAKQRSQNSEQKSSVEFEHSPDFRVNITNHIQGHPVIQKNETINNKKTSFEDLYYNSWKQKNEFFQEAVQRSNEITMHYKRPLK